MWTPDAIAKLQTLPLLAGENISHKFIAPTVASAINLLTVLTSYDVILQPTAAQPPLPIGVLDMERDFVDRYNHDLIDINRVSPEGRVPERHR